MISYAEILVVDDAPEHLALTGSILQAEGYRTFAAPSGQAVKYFLERRLPHLILLDIQMKDISGLEVCRRIKEDPRTKDIPVIFLTSETDKETVSQGFELGAADYIKKPFIKEEFLARVRTQLRIYMQKRELMAANDELTQFCSAVTHDLRAPFSLVNQLISALHEELADIFGVEEPEQVKAIMDIISMKTTQARVMIDRLFEFSKMCNVKPRMKEVDVRAIAEETYADLKELCPERNIRFSCGKLPTIVADETLVRMALKNLLQNAIKYSAKKEEAVIRVTAGHHPTYYVIKVKDNGAGFDMRYVDKIFRVFERLHTEAEFPGTGVGLALVNRIMKRHDGRIEAKGEVGKGAEFTLYFPRNVVLPEEGEEETPQDILRGTLPGAR